MRPVRLLCAALALVFAASLFSCGVPESAPEPEENPEAPAPETPAEDAPEERAPVEFLHVSRDGKLISESGKEVVLRGVNLGGWLLQETWMGAIKGSECNLDSIRLLQSRGFTDEQIQTLYLSYAEHFITEKDVEYLASLGINCVRLPFWYRNFMDEDLNLYSQNDAENPGFILIDRFISWAQANGIYVILDMHGCPGGQSTDHSTGVIGENRLYTEQKYSDAMELLWTRIARHYRTCAAVAAYDIMNEPMNNSAVYENGWRAGTQTAVSYTIEIYDRMIKAIREIDPDHVITVEGIWSAHLLPDPAKYGWTNMMYQLHLYDRTPEAINSRVQELETVRKNYGVAAYVGEFNNSDENQEYAYCAYLQARVSFTMWTYKVAKDNLGNWGLLSAASPEADLENDSYETLLEKWGEVLESEHFTVNPVVEDWIKTYATPLAESNLM